jgi:hypothetical protein
VRESAVHVWFFDVQNGTYKAIRLGGTSWDGDRVFAEHVRRGLKSTESQVREAVEDIWQAHIARLTENDHRRKGRPLPTVPILRQVPDGSDRGDEPYCYGDMSLTAYYEDPVPITVAKTDTWLEFDSYYGSPGSNPDEDKECYAKDPGWWPPPANTDWDVSTCEFSGYANDWGFDRATYSWYINWDWWDNNLSTEISIIQGLQYTNQVGPNWYRSAFAMGEDSDWLDLVTDDDPYYVCWGSQPNSR